MNSLTVKAKVDPQVVGVTIFFDSDHVRIFSTFGVPPQLLTEITDNEEYLRYLFETDTKALMELFMMYFFKRGYRRVNHVIGSDFYMVVAGKCIEK